jgi:hypothetical protein
MTGGSALPLELALVVRDRILPKLLGSAGALFRDGGSFCRKGGSGVAWICVRERSRACACASCREIRLNVGDTVGT